MTLEQAKKLNIPKTPGSYQFLNKDDEIIYVGKAVNLNSRVLSYFKKSTLHTPTKHSMLKNIEKIKWIEVDSEIEALLLETNLIKKYQPKYNVLMRDDKRYQYIKITDDKFPRVVSTRIIDKSGKYFGPFTSSGAVKETIKAIKKIFPFGGFMTLPQNKMNDLKSKRYPEIYKAPENIKEYKRIIKQVINFLEGNSKKVLKDIEKLIKQKEKEENTDMVSALKYRLLNMKNVLAHSNILSVHEKYANDVVELAKTIALPKVPKRIEGYDIAHTFGRETVASMVVFSNGEPNKNEYRKFKIKTLNDKADDTKALKEVLERRFGNDWPIPDLLIIDGGKGQLNACLSILKKLKMDIPIISISKGEGLRSAHAPDKIFFPGEKKALELPLASPALHVIKRVRDEAHRFAITFHRQRRSKKTFQK